MMVRLGAVLIAVLVLLSGLAAGYLIGTHVTGGEIDSELQQANERTVASFYETLGELDRTSGQERLAELLSSDFTEQRLDIQQTISRDAFLRAALQEARTFPDRTLVPTSIAGDRGWAVVMVQTVDAAPGNFAKIPLPASTLVRRELLRFREGQIAGRVVLEGTGSLLRSQSAVVIGMEGFGPQTIKIARRDYSAHAEEQLTVSADALIVVDLGRFSISSSGVRATLEVGESMRSSAGSTLTIANQTDTPARILLLSTAAMETPSSGADANRLHEPAPGVMVTTVAQSEYVVSGDSCLRVEAGHAVLAPGVNLPLHRTVGYELVMPISSEFQASNNNRDFLRTDSERQWQDELPFATLDSSVAVVAPPDSWTTYLAGAQEPASVWVFAVAPSSSCSSSG